MVALEPGRITRWASAGMAAGARRNITSTRFEPQRIEVVEVRHMRVGQDDDAHFGVGLRRTWSIDRKRILGWQPRRIGEVRHEPERAPSGQLRDARHASLNKAASPRNLLTMKASIRRASASGSTAFVPTRLAMTPPRSMSPISTTGT